ncbi:MAG: Rieske (2Fe-2S) protein [Chloroflexi bacterium]|nr:MAG: Rieske (2Fe-2S) protein [Chloroflexota bacterium]
MNDDPEQLDRHVEDLLNDQRPERTPLPDEDALRARQTAAMLRAAKPGAGLPSQEFLHRMQGSINGWVRERAASSPAASGFSRRSVILSGLSGIAAGILAAVGIDRLAQPRPTAATPDLVLNEGGWKGTWQPVMALSEVPQATPVRFSSGALEGYLIRNGDQVRALSAICTHMACVLNWSKLRTRFECPCHGASFDQAGTSTGHYDGAGLPPLPAIKVRVEGGQVQVYTV